MKKGILLLFGLICFSIGKSQTIASFPGAEGFGGKTIGGRGGQVIYVTNLDPSGPGSLNEALATPGPRYILFKVSGIINAAAEVIYGDFTLAGQTSPGGIIVRGFIIDEMYDTIGTGDNIIIRHIRSRPNPDTNIVGQGYVLDDAFRFDGASNAIVDHCSFANGIDECVQMSNATNISLQYCSLAETLGDHFYLGGMLMNYSNAEHPQDSISIHHNIWNRIGGRMPEFSCESPFCGSRPLNIELSNNLIWDQPVNIWYNSNIDQTAPMPVDSFFLNMNWVNNYSVSRADYPGGMIAHDFMNFSENHFYAIGNKMNLYPGYSDYELFYCCNDFSTSGNNPNTDLGLLSQELVRHPFPSITYTPTNNLTNFIYTNGGAFPRDSMDRRLFSHLPSNTPDLVPVDSADHYHDAFILDFNPSNPPAPLIDSDNDGMPDYWETAHSLNNGVQDHNGTGLSNSITGINGYTNLECYINCLSDFLISGQSSFACGITGTTSIKNTTKYEEHVYVYPNPSKGDFTILMPKASKEIKVFNSLGQEIYNFPTKGLTSLNLDLNENGLYVIHILVDNEIVIKKVVICK
ncbi:MAG: T9SS type A sorting domain-containing protein [Bacteroidetes bacterium]|nr:T9SS type A sorting domain-containing protein [Bacteroidota bacterium]